VDALSQARQGARSRLTERTLTLNDDLHLPANELADAEALRFGKSLERAHEITERKPELAACEARITALLPAVAVRIPPRAVPTSRLRGRGNRARTRREHARSRGEPALHCHAAIGAASERAGLHDDVSATRHRGIWSCFRPGRRDGTCSRKQPAVLARPPPSRCQCCTGYRTDPLNVGACAVSSSCPRASWRCRWPRRSTRTPAVAASASFLSTVPRCASRYGRCNAEPTSWSAR